jgi:hypothetical protein
MKGKTYTTVEEGKHLLELGIDPETADMWWYAQTEGNYFLNPGIKDYNAVAYYHEITPCWTIGALLELLPEKIYGPSPKDHSTELLITHKCIGYFDETGMQHGPSFSGEYVESAYKMVCWLLENNYISHVSPEATWAARLDQYRKDQVDRHVRELAENYVKAFKYENRGLIFYGFIAGYKACEKEHADNDKITISVKDLLKDLKKGYSNVLDNIPDIGPM